MERCVGVLARYPVAVLQPLQLPQVANQPKQAHPVRVDAAIAFANDYLDQLKICLKWLDMPYNHNNCMCVFKQGISFWTTYSSTHFKAKGPKKQFYPITKVSLSSSCKMAQTKSIFDFLLLS